MNTPENLRYTRSDEWILVENDTLTLGVSAYAVDELGEIVYVELPELGQSLQKGASCGVIESVKAVGELYAPIGGEVIAVNDAVTADSALLNASPYQDGWLIKLRAADVDLSETLSAEEYREYRGIN